MMHAARTAVRDRGFTLVACILGMTLLSVTLVAFLSVSSIALRSSQQALDVTVARSNARMALLLAIGELQKQAGGDTFVTGTADMAGDSQGDAAADGAAPGNGTDRLGHSTGLTTVQSGTRHWTAVWPTKGAFPNIYSEAPYAKSVRWLVSGNDGSGSMTPATGELTLGADGTPSDPETTALMVGLGGSTGRERLNRAVTAKMIEIAATRSGGKPGRYAWWVGDEGVKARINSRAGYKAGAMATQASYASPRRGWEAVTGFAAYPTPSEDTRISGIVSNCQIGLLDNSLRSPSSPRGAAFHTASSDSFGILSDPLQGGLKVDLTTLLREDLTKSSGDRFINYPTANANIIPFSINTSLKGPKWDTLKAFRDLGANIADNKLTVTQGDNIKHLNIAPLITDLRLLLGARLVAQDTTRYKINPCAKVAIALANPYPYTLAWDKDLELEIVSATPNGNLPSRIFDAAGQPAFLPAALGSSSTPNEAALFYNALFVIPRSSLAPGEARAYTIGSPVVRPAGSTAEVRVELQDFGKSGASDFTRCLEMVHNSVNTTDILLDVRESWTTSTATAILRLAGSTKTEYLRRVERFELDNGFYATVRRPVGSAISQRITKPFPLHCFSFQLSQPGGQYESILPTTNLMGTRSSTQRTYMDYNLQARRFMKPIASYNPPPYFMESSDSLANLPFTAPGGQTGSAFTRNLAISPLPWGRSPFKSPTTVLFSPPRELVSLAQLQHADLTADDIDISVGHEPGNAVGNSYAPPFVKRRNGVFVRNDYTIIGSPSPNSATAQRHTYYDISYLLNTALWDSYFFSTLPESGPSIPTNLSMVVTRSDSTGLRDAGKCAEDLLVEGAFNVNSTNKDAWKALLAGARQLHHPAQQAGGQGTTAFPRSLEQPSAGVNPPTGSDADSFSGFRMLDDDQLEVLATEIVRQVRLRGPFLSVSQFVNRALMPLTTSPELSRSGALQSAIDNAGLNISVDGKMNIFSDINSTTDRVRFQANGRGPRADLDGTASTVLPNPAPMVWATMSKDLNPGAVAGILADTEMLTDAKFRNEQGFRSTGIPGWLTQADVLQVIGPSLAARSDTFRIRGYGECLDANTGKVTAKAWCEAIIQRTTGFVDSTNAPNAATSALSATNQKFGRRFEIISFHWLLPDEI